MRASSFDSSSPSGRWLDAPFNVRNVFGLLVCLAGVLGGGPQLQAQIPVGSLQNFSTLPRTNEWCTAARAGTANTAGSFIDALTLEADIQQIVTVDVILGQVASDPGNPPGTFGTARWSSTGLNVTTRPTGVGYTVLLARIVNSTASDLPSVVLSYDLSGAEVASEDVGLAGHIVFYSLTGQANSWQRLDDLSGGTLGPKITTVNLGSWPGDSPLYVLWVDDNAVNNPDGIYTIDNFLVSTGVNPPEITVNPANTNVVEGRTIALEVAADGAGLTYSWQKLGGQIDPANPTISSSVLIITNATLADAGSYFCVVANAAGSDTSASANVTVDLDVVAPQFVSATADPFDPTIVHVFVDEPLCEGSSITPGCTKESQQAFLWHVQQKNNPAVDLFVLSVTISNLEVIVQTATPREFGVDYIVKVELGVSDRHDNEMPEGASVEISFVGNGFKQNAGGYLGTQDTFISSDAPDTPENTVAYLEADQVNAANGISQALLRFDNVFGDGLGQVPVGSLILSATLTLQHTRGDADGSPVNLHRMLTDWDQATVTWNSMVDGIQADDLEAASVPDGQIISVLPIPFTVELDVTSSVQAWAEGAPNFGWALLNTDANGYRPDSSDSPMPPSLVIRYSSDEDTEGPTVRAVSPNPNGTALTLTFSEPLEPGSAQTTGNYVFTPTVQVTTAALSVDGRIVTLTTAPRPAGVYSLRVSNVTDNQPRRNVLNPNPTSLVVTQSTVVFAYGAGTWKYETNSQDATLLTIPWYSGAFNDGTWQVGQAFFGFEDSPGITNALPAPRIVTPLPPNSDATLPDAAVTAYFRRAVTLPALPARTLFEVSHYVDDGAVFYIDGKEIARFNMPLDLAPVIFTNRALTGGIEASLQTFRFSYPAGNYVMAAEVHQGAGNSSDVLFGAQVSIVPLPFSLGATIQGANVQISWGVEAIGYTLESTTSLGGTTPANWTPVAGTPNPLTAAGQVSSPINAAPKFYRLRK